jgi:NADH dehydrogenase
LAAGKPTIVITGATGFIGSLMADYFAALGWSVIAPVRKIPAGENLHGIRYLQHDLSTAKSITLPESVTAFVHCGYIRQEKGRDAYAENLEAARVLLDAVKERNVQHAVFLSSLSADENALSVYGRQKAAIEKLFLENDGTVLRIGLVIGNGGLFASMRNYLAKRNLIPLFGNGLQPVQIIHETEVVDAVDRVIRTKSKGRFVLATEEPLPYRDFYAQLCESLGVKPRFVRLPFWMAKLMIGTAEFLGMQLPVTKDNLLGLEQMKHIPSAKDQEKLGMKLKGTI